jgi:hypothetical protein
MLGWSLDFNILTGLLQSNGSQTPSFDEPSPLTRCSNVSASVPHALFLAMCPALYPYPYHLYPYPPPSYGQPPTFQDGIQASLSVRSYAPSFCVIGQRRLRERQRRREKGKKPQTRVNK